MHSLPYRIMGMWMMSCFDRGLCEPYTDPHGSRVIRARLLDLVIKVGSTRRKHYATQRPQFRHRWQAPPRHPFTHLSARHRLDCFLLLLYLLLLYSLIGRTSLY